MLKLTLLSFQLNDLCAVCEVYNVVIFPDDKLVMFSWSIPAQDSTKSWALTLYHNAVENTLLENVIVNPHSIKLDYRK